MKLKMAMAALVFAVGSAQAVEVGVNYSYDYGSSDRAGAGITVGQKVGAVGLTAGFDRYTKGVDQNKWSLVGSYDLTKVADVTVTAKAGVVYLDNAGNVANGFAGVVGAGVSYPLTKQVAVTADYRYQRGQTRVEQFNGNSISAGLKYSF